MGAIPPAPTTHTAVLREWSFERRKTRVFRTLGGAFFYFTRSLVARYKFCTQMRAFFSVAREVSGEVLIRVGK